MKFKTLAFLLIFTFMTDAGIGTFPLPYPVEVFSRDTTFSVQRIIDGDTVEIQYNGNPTKVRLIGVDTPETVHPTKPVEAFGAEASAFTRNLLLGESVYLRFDREMTDRHGRLLAYLYRVPDGLFVNLEIVRQGYGNAYTRFPFKHMELFRQYEHRARKAGKGLWNTTTHSKTASPSAKIQTGGQQVPSVPQSVPTDHDEIEVYTTKTGTKYHRAGCRHLKSKKAIALKEAVKRYSPCSVCKPPNRETKNGHTNH